MTWKKHFEKSEITLDHISAALKELYAQNARNDIRDMSFIGDIGDSSIASFMGIPVVVSDHMSIDEWERYRERGE